MHFQLQVYPALYLEPVPRLTSCPHAGGLILVRPKNDLASNSCVAESPFDMRYYADSEIGLPYRATLPDKQPSGIGKGGITANFGFADLVTTVAV